MIIDSNVLSVLREEFGDEVKSSDLSNYENPSLGMDGKTLYRVASGQIGDTPLVKVKRGTYRLEVDNGVTASVSGAVKPKPAPVVEQAVVARIDEPREPVRRSQQASIEEASLLHPKVDPNFVAFGMFHDLVRVLSSDVFAPVMIVGDSGNGKSYSVMQAAAKLKKAIIPVSMDMSTTEEDLIGHYGLVDGNTIYEKGPVRIAAETGSVLLLDELDRANPEALICLNMLLDGYPVFDKKTGDTIIPQPGFKVVATANTKGQGDDSDRFVTAGVLDEAFLERFPIMFEQEYPSASTETKILSKVNDNEALCKELVTWANATRKSYKAGAIDNFITTRRLVMIAGKNYTIFGNGKKAVEHAVARFPATIRDAFIELFEAVSSGEYVDPDMDSDED